MYENANYSYFNGAPIQGMTQQPYGMPMGQFNGVSYGQPQPIKFTNPLGQAKINENLKNGKGLPNLNITQEDYEQAICTHRNPETNQVTAYPMNDGSGKHKCSICGAEFHIIEDPNPEDIKVAADNMWDIGQTAKMLWLDGADNAIKQAFQILALIPKYPQLYTIAANTMQRYNGGFNIQNVNNPQNAAALVNQIFGGPMGMNMGMMGQPVPSSAQPMYNPMAQQNPMIQNPMMQQPMMNPAQQQMLSCAPGIGSNGFGYTVPGMQPQQQPQGQQYNMNLDPNAQLQNQQPAQQPQPQPAPAPTNNSSTTATVTETLHV